MYTGNEQKAATESTLSRYRSYRTDDDGDTVIYDSENDHAWVQSDTTVRVRT